MTNQPTRILFATDQSSLLAYFRAVLRVSGFAAESAILRQRTGFARLHPEDTFLIFVDANRAPSQDMLAQAVRSAPHSRFVLSGRNITPQMLLTAIESGLHGVLAMGLPVEEAAQALLRIWDGERQFRFDCGPVRPAAPPAECDDFDSAWMFGLSA
ncbi:MAG TPA: hypothetical protein VGZ73_23860 [Bryobacteraceae bacterium]|jgi:hypothetical protein|nr:hypothetical protein [Bryobacteraceae bacterium]